MIGQVGQVWESWAVAADRGPCWGPGQGERAWAMGAGPGEEQ